MPFFVISRESSQTIFESEQGHIEFIEFSTRSEADEYIKSGIIHTDNEIRVFTDGACSNNGKMGSKAGIGIYVSDNSPYNISQTIQGKQTNNTAELSAIIKVFSVFQDEISNQKQITIFSDSKYSIQCFTKWSQGWVKNNWKKKDNTDILNKELIKTGYELFMKYKNVSLHHVKAHTDKSDELSNGNREADKLARLAIS